MPPAKMKKVSLYLAIIFITCGSFLFSPCWDAYTIEGKPSSCFALNNQMRVVICADTYNFIWLASEPSQLLQKNTYRQSRPLYVMTGRFVGLAVYYLSYPFHSNIENFLKKKTSFLPEYYEFETKSGIYFFCFYVGFLIINVIILLTCLLLFEKIVSALTGEWKNGTLLFSLILAVLLSHPVTKVFFWSVHQQLFNILTPLLSLYIGIVILKKRPALKKLFLISIGLGLLLLFYGNFLLPLPVLVGSYLYSEKKNGTNRGYITLLNSFLFIFLFFLPAMIWILYLKSINITIYNPELVEYRQFIWIVDKLKEHSFLYFLWGNTIAFIYTSGTLLIPAALLLIFLLWKKISKQDKVYTDNSEKAARWPALVFLVLIETVIFFWLLGYYADRLTSSLAPLLIIIFALMMNRKKLSKPAMAFFTIVLFGFFWYNIFVEPIYFSKYLFNK